MKYFGITEAVLTAIPTIMIFAVFYTTNDNPAYAIIAAVIVGLVFFDITRSEKRRNEIYGPPDI